MKKPGSEGAVKETNVRDREKARERESEGVRKRTRKQGSVPNNEKARKRGSEETNVRGSDQARERESQGVRKRKRKRESVLNNKTPESRVQSRK